jgi:cathepsin L
MEFKLIVAAVAVLLCTANAALSRRDLTWGEFKERYGKRYTDVLEDSLRRTIRSRNLELIKQHNALADGGFYTYHVAENHMSDWTDEEYQQMLGLKRRQTLEEETRSVRGRRVRRQTTMPSMPTYSNTIDVSTLPTYVNWSETNWVGPVMNQGQCGACYTYSATGAIEAQYANVTGSFVQMSEQNLIDCSTTEGNDGCDGGVIDYAFWYVQLNGLDSLATYPDVSNITGVSNDSCAYNSANVVTAVNSWRNIEAASEDALQQAVALVGPVSVGIDASKWSFQFYSSGVYSASACTAAGIDHAVLTVGYGVYQNTTDYWYIQNSWGTDWGLDGFIMMARNDGNMCGIASDASFPVIDG